MNKKAVILVILIILLAVVAAVFLYLKNTAGKNGDTEPRLQGEWTEVAAGSGEPEKCSFQGSKFILQSSSGSKKCSFTVTEGENYNLNPENAFSIQFPEDSCPWYGELVYHTQEVDGHTVRILSSFLYEDDGRGLIVGLEFVHSDDLAYVGSDFCSDLCRDLNDCEAVPTYMTVDTN